MHWSKGHINFSGFRRLPLYLAAALFFVVSGCSAGYKYKVLSFFFDGVPKPVENVNPQAADSTLAANPSNLADSAGKPAEPQLIIHPPYQDRDCGACHDNTSASKALKPMPGLCFQCHDDFSKTYKVMHGPAAGGQCNACHNPHMSTNKGLLIRTGQDICLYCHESADVMKSDAHTDILDTRCTECHNPHGGEDRYVLR